VTRKMVHLVTSEL